MGTWASGTKPKDESKDNPSGVAPSYTDVTAADYGISTEFEADNAVRMPSMSDAALQAAAQQRRDMMARSGRASTNLTRGYSFLGNA